MYFCFPPALSTVQIAYFTFNNVFIGRRFYCELRKIALLRWMFLIFGVEDGGCYFFSKLEFNVFAACDGDIFP